MEKKKILIVKDDYDLQITLTEMFKYLGYRVIDTAVIDTAVNGRMAMELSRSERPHLIIMDGNLSIWDGSIEKGLEIASEIRAKDPLVPIVMISGDANVKFEKIGIQKPFTIQELKKCFAELFEKSETKKS